jgi:hypothetical protein
MLGLRFENRKIANDVEGFVLHRPLVTFPRPPFFRRGHFGHGHLPCPLRRFTIRRAQIRARDSQVQYGLTERLIFRVQEHMSFGLVSGLQARLLFCHGVLGVKVSVVAPIQNESLFHTLPFFFAGNVNQSDAGALTCLSTACVL